MTPKDQYALALSSIRHLRRINRYRAAIPTPASAAWRVRSIAKRQQEILRYSVEHHIMSAAATTIISTKFNDYRFMSNRVLEGWIVKTTCSNRILEETRASISKIQLGILGQLTCGPRDVTEYAISDIEYLEDRGLIESFYFQDEYVGYEGIAIRITSAGLGAIPF